MTTPNQRSGVSAEDLIRHILGDANGYMVTWTKVPGTPAGEGIKQNSWRYPEALQEAISHAQDESAMGHDAYYGVSLFKKDGTRRAEDALDLIDHLWMDSDGYKGRRPGGFPDPTAYVISSPGSYHEYWKLTYPIPKEKAVELNRRLALWAEMDKHLAAITTILRVPGTRNYKRYPEVHEVTGEITGVEPYDPNELEALLPPEPKPEPREPYDGPEDAGFALENWLERHPEARDAIHGERRDGQSRVKYEVTCPWIEEHSTGDNGAYVGQYPDGALWFKCNHGHGDGLRWKDYRRFYESVDDEGYGEVLVDEDLEDIHETSGVPGVSRRTPELTSHTVQDTPSSRDGLMARAQQGVFPVEVLPPVLRQMTEEVVEEMNIPPEYFVNPALSTMASAIGGSRALNVKGSWDATGNVSTATVAESSDKKTPAYKVAIAPAMALQDEAFDKWERDKENYKVQYRRWEVEKKRTPKGEVPPEEPVEPKLQEIVLHNFTPEALGEILNRTPRGILITNDELSGFFTGIDQYKAGKGNERQQHLSIMSGDSYSVRRVSKEPMRVKNPVASYTGGIQPDMLPALNIPKPGGRKGDANDGMLHRWLFAFPPPVDTIDSLEDSRAVSEGAKLQYEFLYKKLRDLGMDEGKPYKVYFTPEAKKKFNEDIYMEWQRRGKRPGVPQLLKSSYGKMADHAARISLVLAFCRDPGTNTGEIVQVEDVEGAAAIIEYYASQMRKVQAILRREKETKDERYLRVLNDLLDKYAHEGRWKVASAELYALLQDNGVYDIPDRATEMTNELSALAGRTRGLTIETNKRVGEGNARGMEIVRATPAPASSLPRDVSRTVQDGSQGVPQDTSGTLTEIANGSEGGLDAGELILFALDRLGRAYPEDLASATGRKLKTVKNALTDLRKAGKVEYTGEKKNQAQEVRLVPPMSSTWGRFTNPTGRADDD